MSGDPAIWALVGVLVGGILAAPVGLALVGLVEAIEGALARLVRRRIQRQHGGGLRVRNRRMTGR